MGELSREGVSLKDMFGGGQRAPGEAGKLAQREGVWSCGRAAEMVGRLGFTGGGEVGGQGRLAVPECRVLGSGETPVLQAHSPPQIG